MDFKDYYATLGVERTATHDEIRRAYRLLARKFHPDVSTLPDAEARFKEVAEAHEALIDPERRAAYDERVRRHAEGAAFESSPGWVHDVPPGDRGGRGSRANGAGRAEDFSEFYEAMFGTAGAGGGPGRGRRAAAGGPVQGDDHHATVAVDLVDAYRGARRTIALRMPVVDASGRTTLQTRELEVAIPKGVREGQRLRLAGQGAAGHGGGAPGDLYLEIRFLPHPRFTLDGRDVHTVLPVAPWEAALGATIEAPTPDGVVQLTVPPGSSPGRTLRLKAKGLPGSVPGDLYVELAIALPPATTEPERQAYRTLAGAFATYDPRREPGPRAPG